MASTELLIVLAAMLAVTLMALLLAWRWRRLLLRRLNSLNDEMFEVASDASVGLRLQTAADGEIGELAGTINRLFETLGDRDGEIQDKDKLFAEFARTLPEIVLVHDERILLANDKAASLIGLEPEQLEGRKVVDLIKPAYRALFRKTTANRLAGESAPRQIEIQLVNGAE